MLLKLTNYITTFQLKGTGLTQKRWINSDVLVPYLRNNPKCGLWDIAKDLCHTTQRWYGNNDSPIELVSCTLLYDVLSEKNIFLAVRIGNDSVPPRPLTRHGVEVRGLEAGTSTWIPGLVLPLTDAKCKDIVMSLSTFREIESAVINCWYRLICISISSMRVRNTIARRNHTRKNQNLFGMEKYEALCEMGKDLALEMLDRFDAVDYCQDTLPTVSYAEIREQSVTRLVLRYLNKYRMPELTDILSIQGYHVKNQEEAKAMLTRLLEYNVTAKTSCKQNLYNYGILIFI